MDADADLLGIGQHCAMPDCNQLDFLPFKCDCCNKTYCLSHRTYTAHSCSKAGAKTLDVLPCPICAKGIHLSAGDDPNLVFDRHVSSTECDPANYARVMKKKKCPVPGCREKLTTINTYTCKSCKQTVCLKHRLENDHKCSGNTAAAAASAAGRSIGSLFQDRVTGTAAVTSSSNSSHGSSNGAQQRHQQQLRSRAEVHQQQQAQQQKLPSRAEARRAAATAASHNPANTLHGSVDRRRQLLGLPPRQQQQQQQQQQLRPREVCPQCGVSFATSLSLYSTQMQHTALVAAMGPQQVCSSAVLQARSLLAPPAAGGSRMLLCW
ncbi:hypothetical protein COO60DRAFT_981515 [Scenedesmus sp. NREL 46B-D3]|nr:hypothetical protein COO60DRAFT_981515 [Scenedesmus sp. NREL 46B-D3]